MATHQVLTENGLVNEGLVLWTFRHESELQELE